MPRPSKLTAQEKATLVLAALKEEKSIAQLAAEHGVHASQIHQWKKQAESALVEVFSRESPTSSGKELKQAEAQAKLVASLYQEIGQLSTQLSWLKKKSGYND
jgi:transposase